MQFFKYTTEDFINAKVYLEFMKKLHMLDNEQSTDGYTLVDLANHIKEDNESKINLSR